MLSEKKRYVIPKFGTIEICVNRVTLLKALIFQEEDDLPYEEEILRNPFSVKCWLRYIEFKKDAADHLLNMVYERALKELPGRCDT